MKRVLICGSRDWNDYQFMIKAMTKFIAKHDTPETIIEGCARGADKMAGHQWVEYINNDPMGTGDIGLGTGNGIMTEHYPANWDLHGKAAGPIRNQQMLTEGRPDAVIAFSKSLATSRGTADMVRRARKAGIPVWIPFPQS